MSTNATQRFNRISEQGMCIGCGLCEAAAGADTIKMTETEYGLRPIAQTALDDALMERIEQICPGTSLQGLPNTDIKAAPHDDLVWGPYHKICWGWAGDESVRHQGSTGGALTALALYLIDSGEVSFILHAKAASGNPSFGEAHVSETPQDVLTAAGSRYGPTATLKTIQAALDRAEPFAYIGKPCDLSALRRYDTQDERVGKFVKYFLTPVCGGFATPQFIKTFIRDNLNKDPKTLRSLRYRGYGCPGPTRLEFDDGEIIEASYTDFWGTGTSWPIPFRCKICPDGIGDAADIAAADTWAGGGPNPDEDETLDKGSNALVIRTRAGLALAERAAEAGFLTLGEDITPEQMNQFQPHQRDKKYAAHARLRALKDLGRVAPHTENLRIEALAADTTQEQNNFQYQGTQQRVKIGKADEPTPA